MSDCLPESGSLAGDQLEEEEEEEEEKGVEWRRKRTCLYTKKRGEVASTAGVVAGVVY